MVVHQFGKGEPTDGAKAKKPAVCNLCTNCVPQVIWAPSPMHVHCAHQQHEIFVNFATVSTTCSGTLSRSALAPTESHSHREVPQLESGRVQLKLKSQTQSDSRKKDSPSQLHTVANPGAPGNQIGKPDMHTVEENQ